ncbi:MAG: phosphoenolpyruvate--protein phosphotransferase [Alphaproteobacteria bacterium]|nr:phosphoenolpyruvate--protein phosphotransferase [Alphaproteobacteria bacterium]
MKNNPEHSFDEIKTCDTAPPIGTNEQVYSGIGVSTGIVIGKAYVHNIDTFVVPRNHIKNEQIKEEQNRFDAAAKKTITQITKMQNKAQKLGAAGEEMHFILDAYNKMLEGSRLVRGVKNYIEKEEVTAEFAVQEEINTLIKSFESMDDSYLAARAEDLRGIERRLLRNLYGKPLIPFSGLPKDAIIFAKEMTPADTALLDPNDVSGFATVLGGAQSHTGIMAKSLNIPAVVAIEGLLEIVRTGDLVIIDGDTGKVIIFPTKETHNYYRGQRATYISEKNALKRLSSVPSITKDNIHISLKANIELPREVKSTIESGAEGIGLLRSEFMFMNRDTLPSADEQFEALKEMIEKLDGRMLTVRTLDVGGDKLSKVIDTGSGANPALGLRAIRLSLYFPKIIEAQFEAILRASAYGPVKIMLPMINSVHELIQAKEILEKIAEKLKKEKVPMANPLPPIGVMIEIPSAALTADILSWHADFFSIGTNDLIQYTLAIDRTNEKVAHMFDPLHPAVLKMIDFTTKAALNAHIPIAVCGEMAGDPALTPLLLGLGVRELSMPSSRIPLVKKSIMNLSLRTCVEHAKHALEQTDSKVTKKIVDSLNHKLQSY